MINLYVVEAGLLALRERRMKVVHADFKKAKDKVMYQKKEGLINLLFYARIFQVNFSLI